MALCWKGDLCLPSSLFSCLMFYIMYAFSSLDCFSGKGIKKCNKMQRNPSRHVMRLRALNIAFVLQGLLNNPENWILL